MKKLLLSLIEVYQNYLSFDKGILAFLAPGGACRFETRCSEYTKQVIREFGVIQGSWLGIKRIGSCR